MLLYIYLTALEGLIVSARDVSKTLKTLPFVTNSLVNLGKMDISFHFNAHPKDLPSKSELIATSHGSSSLFSPKLQTMIEEPCPCSNLPYLRDPAQNHPTELLNRILSGNDLFSFKETTSSPLCCDSHENVQDDILLEFGPRHNQFIANPQNSNSFSFLPYLLDTLSNRPTLPTASIKPKAVEIFFFPNKRGITPKKFDMFTTKKKAESNKDSIKVVGDKEIRNDFNTLNFVPPNLSSVKKDLVLEERNKQVTQKADKYSTPVDKHLNTV